jgi:hypothetical protein
VTGGDDSMAPVGETNRGTCRAPRCRSSPTN